MLRTRLIVAIIMLPVLIFIAAWGGWGFSIFVSIVMGLAGWEFWRMFYRGGYAPSAVLTIGGAALFCFHHNFQLVSLQSLLTGFVMITAAVHLIKYERGQINAPFGFCITLAGALYWGLLGSYLIQLRELSNGFWWLMLALPAVWLSDAGGYFIGGRFGKHFMAPRLSPKKTWEGYVGGILFAVIFTSILGALWHIRIAQITWLNGLLLGAFIAVLVPLGDFTASMFKRIFSVKDSSNLIPGHGGVIDRIDTWVWAAVLGYFFVLLLP